MTITQRLMKPGRFHIELTDNYPDSIAAAIGLFDHVVVTPTPVDVDSNSDAGILAMASYTGVITARPSLRIFEGADLSLWLGTDQGIGDLLTATGSIITADLPAWISTLCPASLTVGTVNNAGATGNLTNWYQFVTRREAIDAVCRYFGAEWRVNPNGTLDVAIKANLFASPSASGGIVVTRKAEGLDGALRGLDASLLVPGSDVEQYTTAVYALGQGTGPAVLNSVATDMSGTYKDLKNGAVVMARIVSAPSDPAAVTTNIANSILGQFHQVRRAISLSSNTYTVTRFVKPGDEVYVFDLRAGLTDPANQIEWRGELIAPVKQRVFALTWPLERGCGVYLRKSGTTPTYLDLTPYIAWENGDVQWEIGSASQLAIGGAENLGTAYLPTTAAAADKVAPVRFGGSWSRVANQVLTNGTPTAISFDTEAADPQGFSPPMPSATFTVPTGFGGVYAITFIYTFGAAITGACMGWVNAGTYISARVPTDLASGNGVVTMVVPLTAGQTIAAAALQTSGGNRNLIASIDIYQMCS